MFRIYFVKQTIQNMHLYIKYIVGGVNCGAAGCGGNVIGGSASWGSA